MNFIDYVFLFYSFVGLYMVLLMLLLYFPNKEKMFKYQKGTPEPVSIIVPCHNAESNIGNLIDNLQNMDWPKNMMEIIIVDDASTDNSQKIIQKYAKKYNNIRYIFREKNFGRAAGPTNQGIKIAKYDYIVVCDDDSTPGRDSLKKMIGFIQQDDKIAGVTNAILVKNPKKFIEKLQAIEYAVISFTRKLFDFANAVYVTPGPFALYKKKILIEVGLFDEKNMTQDIEIVWRLRSHGYGVRMCLGAKTYVHSPKKVKSWWNQRIRWNIGGNQTLWKYKNKLFRKNILGVFIIPFFSASLFLGIFGIGILAYLLTRRALSAYLNTFYSVHSETAILTLQELSLNPSILNFIGIALFIIGSLYILFGISTVKELKVDYINFYSMGIFLTIYLLIFPLNMLHSLIKIARRKYSW